MKIRLGRHSLNIIFEDEKINFRFIPNKFRSNAFKELYFLDKLSRSEVNVPRIIHKEDMGYGIFILRGYIPGMHFKDFIRRGHPAQVKKCIIELVRELHKIENLGIYIPEFRSLTKNVVVGDDGKPYIIDVERARFSKRLIVTKFLDLLALLGRSPEYREKIGIIDLEKIRVIAKNYRERRDIDEVLEFLKKLFHYRNSDK